MKSNSNNSFKLCFDGQLHQIEANVLISSLIHNTTIISEINKRTDPAKQIKINVNAPEKGSFIIELLLNESIIDQAKSLFSKENVEYVYYVITSLAGAYHIKNHLKGKKAKSVKEKSNNRVEITNADNNTIIINSDIYNIYTSSIIPEAISQNFDALHRDGSIESFEIRNNKGDTLYKASKEDFVDLSVKSEEINEDERIVVEMTVLNIVRASFKDNLKWEFYYRGMKISASLADESFIEEINRGRAFAKGDSLNVQLQITQKWDPTYNTFTNKSYKILQVSQHIRKDEQTEFNFSQ